MPQHGVQKQMRIQLPSIKLDKEICKKVNAVPLINFWFGKHGYILNKNVIYANMKCIFVNFQ